MLFYVSQRRVWAMVRPGEGGGSELIMAGVNQRSPEAFEQEFETIANAVDGQIGRPEAGSARTEDQ